MRRTGIAIALAVVCACSEQKKAEPAPTPPPPAPAKRLDMTGLIHDVEEARGSDDPEKAVLAAVAKACACKAETIDAAAKVIADGVARASNEEKEALGDALAHIQVWTPPAPGVTLPPASHAQGITGWGVIVLAKDGSTQVARSARTRLTLAGSESVAGADLRDATGVLSALRALDPGPTEPPPAEDDGGAFANLEAPGDISDDVGSDVDYGELFGEDDNPCSSGSGGFGFGISGTGPGGIGEGHPTIGTGRYGTIGRGSGTGEGYGIGGGRRSGPRFSVRAVKGRVLTSPVILADAAAPMQSVFLLLRQEDVALGVQSGARVAAFALVSCSWGGGSGPSLNLEGGVDGKTIRELYEQQTPGATSVTLRVSDNASYGDVIGALDALVDAGVTEVGLESAQTGATGRIIDVPSVRIGQPQAVGDLDKATIRRYIKRNISKITYCYEKQLIAKPGLEGTVSVKFFIKPDGTVAASNASGVDPAVSSCVAEVIFAIEFPKPKGGGGVQVEYPFTFRPSGG